MRTQTIVLSALMLLLSACAAPVKEQAQSGFLRDYSRLEKVDDQRYLFVSDKLANYDQYTIAPIAMLVEFDDPSESFTEEELDELKAYFVQTLSEALSKGDNGYKVASGPGEGVIRYRMGITALDKSVGALNLSIYTKITGAGLGGLAIEMEAIDSLTGEQLAATVRWGNGSRILRAGYTKTGDAKILIKRWSKDARSDWDRARGIKD